MVAQHKHQGNEHLGQNLFSQDGLNHISHFHALLELSLIPLPLNLGEIVNHLQPKREEEVMLRKF